jgi:YHS domain-containing protein
MLFIELFVPKGVFDDEERRRLAERLTAERLLAGAEGGPEGADPGVIGFFESVTHVVIREPEVWIVDGKPFDPAEAPRYVVNVYVGAWAKEMSEHLITAITRELAAAEGDLERLYREPHALVHVIGVPEGGYGLFGKAHRSSDLLEMINKAKTAAPAEAPPGMVIDPVCGATVPIEEAVALQLDGTTYGFCCTHCRGHFVKQRKAEVS